MNRIAITLALALAACTDTTEVPAEPAVVVTLPELPEVTLLYGHGVVVVVGQDGTELCAISNETGSQFDAAAITHECGVFPR